MELHGSNLIGGATAATGERAFAAVDPRNGESLAPSFAEATEGEIDRALELATEAHRALKALPAEQRADFLDAIAAEIDGLGDELLDRASLETGISLDRLTAERGRTTGQLQLFAGMVREGVDRVVRDAGFTNRRIALGPVAVFGASNFPLAFSVAGGDTASAFAAGCPVIVKAHPSHPGTSELVGRAVLAAAAKTGMPEGVFSLVHGQGPEAGKVLVKHPDTRAVAFTGSLAGGRALFDLASRRPNPVPLFAEMGSTNPMFLLPNALAARRAEIADGLFDSLTIGVGQYCTNPGLVFVARGPDADALLGDLRARVAAAEPGTMLNAGIASAYRVALGGLSALAGVEVVGAETGTAAESACSAKPALLVTDADLWLAEARLREEIFGPATLVVRADAPGDFVCLAEKLAGQLTATVHADEGDHELCRELIPFLEERAGRVVFNGFPTGVRVNAAMHHGGPYPATTDPRFTSVGTAAIDRFLRPVCYQGVPDELLG